MLCLEETAKRFANHIGVDEAGRGCLAGPVVAAAVLFPPDGAILSSLPELDDSKKLTAAIREALAPAITDRAAAWSIGLAWPEEIDAVNILNATFRAMSRAVSRLNLAAPCPPLVIDGNHVIRSQAWTAVTRLPLPEQTAVVGGDALVPCIAAASVLAKTFRDRLMKKLDAKYPGYGFAAHKGYGTCAHRDALRRLGPSPMHRQTFRCVRPEERQHTLL